MRTRSAIAVTAGLLAALTACSSGSSSPSTAPPGSGTAAASTQPSTPAPAKALDAAGMTAKLAKTIPTIKLTVTYNATSDPNQRMGRPHQYLSKTAFDDTRVSDNPKASERAKDRNDIAYGGTVEVFATPEDAETWFKYIDGLSQALGGMVQPDYYYRNGAVVVRVSHLLTPEQAKQYEQGIS